MIERGLFYLINVTHDNLLHSPVSQQFSCGGAFTSSHDEDALWTEKIDINYRVMNKQCCCLNIQNTEKTKHICLYVKRSYITWDDEEVVDEQDIHGR